jgi:hypothetical protein
MRGGEKIEGVGEIKYYSHMNGNSIKKPTRAGGVTQMVGCLPSKSSVLSSIPVPQKEKKKRSPPNIIFKRE